MRFPIRLKGKVPKTISLHEKQGLTACPVGSDNCVSSVNAESATYVAPLGFNSSPVEALLRLKSIVLSLGNTRLARESSQYLWFECESDFFGFVDDLECQVVPDRNIIHVRSGSRLGRKDFGVNRKRIDAIKSKWPQA